MFDLLITCRDALSNSLLGCVATAILTKKQEGLNVGLMFTQEAVIALAEGKFRLSPLLEPYDQKIETVRKQFNFPQEPVELVRMAKKAGVTVFTCSVWSEMMGLAQDLPEELEIVSVEELMKRISNSKKILGSF